MHRYRETSKHHRKQVQQVQQQQQQQLLLLLLLLPSLQTRTIFERRCLRPVSHLGCLAGSYLAG